MVTKAYKMMMAVILELFSIFDILSKTEIYIIRNGQEIRFYVIEMQNAGLKNEK